MSYVLLLLSQPIGKYVFIGLYIYLYITIILPLFPISIYNVCYDAVYHIVKEGLSKETIMTGNNIFHVEHAYNVSNEIGCFGQWRRQPFALNGNGRPRVVIL